MSGVAKVLIELSTATFCVFSFYIINEPNIYIFQMVDVSQIILDFSF